MSAVVVTGLGIVSPLGIGLDSVEKSLREGRTGIARLELPNHEEQRTWLVANVSSFDPKEWVTPRKSIKLMSRETQMGFAAAVAAFQNAGHRVGEFSPDRLGVLFGSSLIFSEFTSLSSAVQACTVEGKIDHRLWGEKMREQIDPLWLLRSLPNMPACHVSIALDARGPCNTLTVEETSGLAALSEAAMAIQQGKADIMVVGVAGGRTNGTRLLQRHECLFTPSSNPELSCRPFDEGRDGTVPAEGAAACVLESESFARKRGANILATLDSWGNRFAKPAEPLGASSRSVKGAIEAALHRSRFDLEDIDFVLASANGSILIDRAESQGIHQVGKLPATSLKSRFGDAASGSGLIELVAGIVAVRDGMIPHTLFHRKTASDCPCPVIFEAPRIPKHRRLIQISSTPHGHCMAALFSIG